MVIAGSPVNWTGTSMEILIARIKGRADGRTGDDLVNVIHEDQIGKRQHLPEW
jgi:hypothetical protein